MNCKDLMIGDLVIFEDNVHKVTDLSLCIDGSVLVHVDGHDVQIFEHEISPIPLSEEILKANADGGSCSFDEFRSIYHLKNNGYHREISIEFDKTWHVPFVEITGMGHTTIKVNMQYVHELQHALRLCGLNELADNFKLE